MDSPSNDVQEPLHAGSICSDTFWEEDASGIPASDLFHFTADIKGRPGTTGQRDGPGMTGQRDGPNGFR